MGTISTLKEQEILETPLLLFECELRNGDRLWSLDGRRLGAVEAFDAVWQASQTRATEWVVVRRREDGAEYFAEVTLPANAGVAIRIPRHSRRKFNLID